MPAIKIGTQTIYYDEYGKGEPVILIPGLGANRFSWMKQIAPFSGKYRIINIDNRDAGSSGYSSGPYNIIDMTNDVAGLIETLNLKSVNIIGISMGSFITQYLALNYPQYVRKIILASSSAGGETHVYPKPEILALLNQNQNDDMTTRTKRLFSLITGPGFATSHPDDVDRFIDNALKLPMSHEAYLRQLTGAKTHNIQGTRDQLHRITIPTLIIHGEYDPIMPYDNGLILSKEIPNAHFLSLPDVGHLPHIEATETFNRTVLDFLGSAG